MQTLELVAMNTSVLLAAEGQNGVASGLEAAQAFIEQSERRFSRFLPQSEVSCLNQSAGEWRIVSQELMEMLVLSLGYYHETGGLFDPSILPALKRAGYDRSMNEIRHHGASAFREAPQSARADFRQIETDTEGQRVRLPPSMEIDLGGIAKGWIVEKAATLLEGYSTACAVSAGGDIVFRGSPRDSWGWRVNIEDPLDPSRVVWGLQLGPCAVATSSVAKRSWQQGGRVRHHLIDPRTAEPVAADALSVTVVSPTMVAAEVYAKALLIGGERERPRLASRRPELVYFVVRSDGSLVGTPTGAEHVDDLHFTHPR